MESSLPLGQGMVSWKRVVVTRQAAVIRAGPMGREPVEPSRVNESALDLVVLTTAIQ